MNGFGSSPKPSIRWYCHRSWHFECVSGCKGCFADSVVYGSARDFLNLELCQRFLQGRGEGMKLRCGSGDFFHGCHLLFGGSRDILYM